MTDNNISRKNSLRKIFQAKRQALSPQDQKLASEALVKIFFEKIDLINLNKYQNIAAYLPMPHKGELDLNLLIQKLLDLNKNIYLPQIQKDSKILKFEIFKKNQKDKEPISIKNLDLVLLPLVSFDSAGNRLGMGGGYYDASFANKSPKTDLIGCAHSFQKTPELLPKDPWDVPVQGILTEQDLIWFF